MFCENFTFLHRQQNMFEPFLWDHQLLYTNGINAFGGDDNANKDIRRRGKRALLYKLYIQLNLVYKICKRKDIYVVLNMR